MSPGTLKIKVGLSSLEMGCRQIQVSPADFVPLLGRAASCSFARCPPQLQFGGIRQHAGKVGLPVQMHRCCITRGTQMTPGVLQSKGER